MSTKPPAEEDRIYISDLAKIVNREIGTIRKWEREGRLPKKLMPKRGHRGWRYWTKNQVHGKNGLIDWMKKNDMRPGNLMTDPSKEAEHVQNLRRPKYLNGNHLRSAKEMAENGRSAEYIIRKIFPRTRYARPENLEAALRQVADQDGWVFPEAKKK